MSMQYIAYQRLQQQAALVLTRWGMPEDLIPDCVYGICMADLLGIDSHGISMLPTYETKWLAGTLNLQARPERVKETAVLSVWDGQAGLGHVASIQAMRGAMQMASTQGVGVAVIRNSHHFGAAGVYARMALEQDMLALVTSSAITPILVPTGAKMPVLGTNPIAFAAPAKQGDAFVLDMATTTVAANKLRVYAYEGKSLPPGWVVDDQAAPVTDTGKALDWVFKQVMGGLTPLGASLEMGGHKGYGLAMLAQILGATLSGAGFSSQADRQGQPDDVGHFMLVLNPALFRATGEFQADLSDMLQHMRGLSPADPAVPVKVAGDPEREQQQKRTASGVPMSLALLEELRQQSVRLQIPFMLE